MMYGAIVKSFQHVYNGILPLTEDDELKLNSLVIFNWYKYSSSFYFLRLTNYENKGKY